MSSDPQTTINLLKRFINYMAEALPEHFIPHGLIDEAEEYIYRLRQEVPPTLSGGRDND